VFAASGLLALLWLVLSQQGVLSLVAPKED
jgi:hypothetical protein